MIATLQGVVSEKLPDLVVIDVGGVGYGLLVTVEDYVGMVVGNETKAYIYEHIRENTHDLYGFTKKDSKTMFELLISVNGVGPKMALNVLNLGSTENVCLAIAEGNLKFIQSASGVGKRVAERLVVELKDKVGLQASDTATTFLQAPNFQSDQAAQALVALGYSAQDASFALKDIDQGLAVEERVKQALKGRK